MKISPIWTLVVLTAEILSTASCTTDGADIPTPHGPDVPPHVTLVQPVQDVTFARDACIRVTLDVGTGAGASPDHDASGISLYVDGERITNVVWSFEEDPPVTGSIKEATDPGRCHVFAPGRHVFDVRYRDLDGQEFRFFWQATALDVPELTSTADTATQ